MVENVEKKFALFNPKMMITMGSSFQGICTITCSLSPWQPNA